MAKPRAAAAETLYPKGQTQAAAPAGGAAEAIALRQQLDARMGGLRVERYSWWTHWREIADYIFPRRYKWLVTPNQGNRGSAINQRIIDNTATRAQRILAAGMMSGMTSPGRPWFKLEIADRDLMEYPPVKAWLDEVGKRLRVVFAVSNFYTSMHTVYEDLATFASALMFMYEDHDDVIRCYNACAGEYFLANGPRLNVDTAYREFVRTTYQLVKEFGIDNVSDSVKQAYLTGGAALTRELIVNHACEPNPEYVPGAKGHRGMLYGDSYWEAGSSSDRFLVRRGFHECPFIAPRWSIVANDAYGRGPGMDVLGDVKQLQVQQKRKSQALDKLVNPPMVADVQLKNEPATLLPGGVTYVTNTQGVGFKPAYEVKPDLSAFTADMKEVQGRIERGFYTDLFLLISQMEGVQPRNDLEILKREEEKLIQVGPVIERFENEALDPGVERAFAIANRMGLIPPPPRELAGHYVKPEYISMLSVAQKAAMTSSIERFVTFIGRQMAVDPEAMDNLDFDEAAREYADLVGVPAKIVRPMVEVLTIRRDKAKAKQQEAAMQTTLAGVQGAKVLSETDVGGGRNALAAMLGNDK